jgi:hypothetical protein
MAGCANRVVMAGDDCPKPGAVLMLQQVCPVCLPWHHASPWHFDRAMQVEVQLCGI